MNEMMPGIRARRKASGMTLEDLAAAVGCTKQTVSYWENGGLPTADRLPAIARALGCTIDELYTAPGEDPSTSLRFAQDDSGARPEDEEPGGASSAPTDDYNQEV